MRLTRKLGGAKLGEGSKGIVYDVYSPEDEESFYSIINSKINDIEKIVLYSSNYTHAIGKSSVKYFVNYLKTTSNLIAKIIKKKSKNHTLKPSHYKKLVDDEIRSNKKVLQKFGKYAQKYLTVIPKFIFENMPVIACKIHYKNNTKDYVIFGNKCGSIQNINIDTVIVHILESLVIMEKNGILHNDIKYDNIMFCDNRYKLIDWGNSTFDSKIWRGTFMGPLRSWLSGHSLQESLDFLPTTLKTQCPEMFNSSIIRNLYTKNINEFKTLISGYNRETVKKTYKGNHDLFSFGWTLLEIACKENIDYRKYIKLVEMLTSYSNPVSANAVLEYVNIYYV